MEKLMAGLLVLLGCILLLALFSLISPLWIMPLWNWLMPTLFGLTKITYWQAWGISLLCGSLFKSASVSSSK